MDDAQLEEVRRLLNVMRRKATPDDAMAQQMIRKYERLFREELARRAAAQQQSHDDDAAA